jgi:hypothetical protein
MREGCPRAGYLLRFFKPRPTWHEPAWWKWSRLGEGLCGQAPCSSTLCVCKDVWTFLQRCAEGNMQPGFERFWTNLREGRIDRVRRMKGLAAGGEEEEACTRHREDVLREVLGNPFDPPAIEANWLAAQDGAVRKLARSVEEDGDFSRLPILGDALEEAGCVDAELLEHCRKGGVHLPGCWVLGRILGG